MHATRKEQSGMWDELVALRSKLEKHAAVTEQGFERRRARINQ